MYTTYLLRLCIQDIMIAHHIIDHRISYALHDTHCLHSASSYWQLLQAPSLRPSQLATPAYSRQLATCLLGLIGLAAQLLLVVVAPSYQLLPTSSYQQYCLSHTIRTAIHMQLATYVVPATPYLYQYQYHFIASSQSSGCTFISAHQWLSYTIYRDIIYFI